MRENEALSERMTVRRLGRERGNRMFDEIGQRAKEDDPHAYLVPAMQ